MFYSGAGLIPDKPPKLSQSFPTLTQLFKKKSFYVRKEEISLSSFQSYIKMGSTNLEKLFNFCSQKEWPFRSFHEYDNHSQVQSCRAPSICPDIPECDFKYFLSGIFLD